MQKNQPPNNKLLSPRVITHALFPPPPTSPNMAQIMGTPPTHPANSPRNANRSPFSTPRSMQLNAMGQSENIPPNELQRKTLLSILQSDFQHPEKNQNNNDINSNTNANNPIINKNQKKELLSPLQVSNIKANLVQNTQYNTTTQSTSTKMHASPPGFLSKQVIDTNVTKSASAPNSTSTTPRIAVPFNDPSIISSGKPIIINEPLSPPVQQLFQQHQSVNGNSNNNNNYTEPILVPLDEDRIIKLAQSVATSLRKF